MNTAEDTLASSAYGASPASAVRASNPAPVSTGKVSDSLAPATITHILDQLHHGIVMTDGTGRVVYANRSAGDLLGCTREEFMGCSFAEVLMRTGAEQREEQGGEPDTSLGTHFTMVLHDQGIHRRTVEIQVAPLSEDEDANCGELYELHDVSESLLRTRQLLHDATHDPLTGLLNRRALMERLHQVIQWAPENGSESVLAMLDLDGFKRINDECGHLVGDEVLGDIARLLQTHTRKADMAVRLGGDEFIILLVDCSLDEGYRLIEVIRQAVADYRFNLGSTFYRVTASIGIVAIDRDIPSASHALHRADQVCYQAKHAGGDCIRLSAGPNGHRVPGSLHDAPPVGFALCR